MGRSSDFKFWEEKLPVHHHTYQEDEVGACSPPMWRRGRVEFRPESSSLLPQHHQYSCLSPTSRIRAIIDGQRELMEMIKDMPESSYELSLKDMVDQQSKDNVPEEKVEDEIVKHERENRIGWRGKSGKTKISRSESMESDVFLLKMFIPASLSSLKKKKKKKKKKKMKPRKHPRKCQGKKSEGPEKQTNKDWWKIIFITINIGNQTSEKKHQSRRRRGCLF